MSSASEKFEAVSPTLDSLGVSRETSLLIGGAGLAAYGINTHRGVNSAIVREGAFAYQPFDIDVLLLKDDFEKLRETARDINDAYLGGTRIDIPPQDTHLLPFSGILYDERGRQEMLYNDTRPEVINGINVLPAFLIAKHKNERNEPRDTVGLVLGHMDAYHDGLPVSHDSNWLSEIKLALRRARNLAKMPHTEVQQIAQDFAFPADFTNALEDNFQDDAFRDISA